MKLVMKIAVAGSLILLLICGLYGSFTSGGAEGLSPQTWPRPELEYFKAVNRVGPPQNPQVLFLLVGHYASANMHREGVEFFSALLKEFEPRLSHQQKSFYLAALGMLRAGSAGQVPLLKRRGWVRDTIDILEEAKRLSGGDIFVVRWISGVVYAQLPGSFNQRKAALADLSWCVENAEKAPHPGWLREVYYHLASIHRSEGQTEKAKDYLRLSGYTDFDKPFTLTTPYAEDLATGHTFSSKKLMRSCQAKCTRYLATSSLNITSWFPTISAN